MSDVVSRLLNRKASEVKAPPMLPEGHYVFRISGLHEAREVRDGIWVNLNVPLEVVQPCSDITVADIKGFSGELVGWKTKFSVLLDNQEGADNESKFRRLVKLLKDAGIDPEYEEETVSEQLARSVGETFVGHLTYRVQQGTNRKYAEIYRTYPVSDFPST